jgi:hypothetical protein
MSRRCTCPPAHPDDLARHEDDCPMALDRTTHDDEVRQLFTDWQAESEELDHEAYGGGPDCWCPRCRP